MHALLRRLVIPLTLAAACAFLVAGPAHAATAVSGLVVDANGAPVTGTIQFCNPTGAIASCGGTGFSGGSYSVSRPDGDHRILITASSVDGLSRYYRAGHPAGTTDAALATVVSLAGTPVVLESMTLPAIATLSGTVTNGAGDPMPGVTVLRNRSGAVTSRVTDAQGGYDFGWVQGGSTEISVNGSGGWAGDRVLLDIPGSGAQVVDLTMREPAHVAGTLTDADSGLPVPHLDVAVFQRVGSAHVYAGGATTDAAGHYDVGGLGSGEVVLRYTDPLGGYPTTFSGGAALIGDATPVSTTPGSTTAYDESLTQVADDTLGRSLSGVVDDAAGQPVAGVLVTARSTDGGEVQVDLTDRSGRWGIDVPNGDYTLRSESGSWLLSHESQTPWFPEFYPDAWGAADATTIHVADDVHAGLDQTLERSGRLSLAAVGPGGSSDLNAGYRVYGPDGALVAQDPPEAFDGSALELLVRPGSWRILVTGRGGEAANDVPLLSRWFGGGNSLATAPATTFVAGSDVAGGVVTLPGALKATTKPRAKGTPRVGRTLTLTKGVWNQMTGTTYVFRWKRGARLVGKTQEYVVRPADQGGTLAATVTAKNGGLATKVTVRVRVR